METCRYCSVPIDKQIALHAAATQNKVNEACSDASYLRTAAVVMWVFLGLSFIPFLGIFNWAFLVTLLVVLVLGIRWQAMFGSIITADPDYQRARRSWIIALMLWIAAIIVGFVIRTIIYLLLFSRFSR